MCKVSVLVPIYNVEKYLWQCLSSLSSQDLEEMEIICLNDGSTDNSLEIAQRFEKKDRRFQVIDKENSGYGKTMNLGLRVAKGEYIGIVESDDYIESDMFSVLYDLARKNQVDVVKSSFWEHVNGFDRFGEIIDDDLYEKILGFEERISTFYRNPSIWSNLYRKKFLEENHILFTETPGAAFQDIAWRAKVFTLAPKIFFTKRAFYHYRRDNMDASVRSPGKLYCVCDEYDEAERYLSCRAGWDEKYQYYIPCFRFGHYRWNCFSRWLDIRSRWAFYTRMYDTFAGYEAAGRLRREHWDRDEWVELQYMLSHREGYFCKHYAEPLRRAIIMHGLMALFGESKKIAIYGAGKVGMETLAALSRHGVHPDCFVVTDVSENAESVGGLPVRAVDDIAAERAGYAAVIAVGAATQPEILARLLDMGFSHIVPFMPEVRKMLR